MLVVRHADAEVVEAFLEDRQHVSHALDDEKDDEAIGDGVSVMHDLFVAADRLVRAPWDFSLISRITQFGSVVATSRPPYGVDPSTWDELARHVTAVTATAGLDDETVADVANRLRWFLRDYV